MEFIESEDSAICRTIDAWDCLMAIIQAVSQQSDSNNNNEDIQPTGYVVKVGLNRQFVDEAAFRRVKFGPKPTPKRKDFVKHEDIRSFMLKRSK